MFLEVLSQFPQEWRVCAGGKFLLYITSGTAIWNVTLVCPCAFTGARWERVNKYMAVYSSIAFAIMAAFGIVYDSVFILNEIKSKHSVYDVIFMAAFFVSNRIQKGINSYSKKSYSYDEDDS